MPAPPRGFPAPSRASARYDDGMAKTLPTLLATVLAFCVSASAQKPKEPPDDPNLPARLDELEDMVKDRKMEQDFRAISLIQEIGRNVEKSSSKDKKKIVKALGDVFTDGKTRAGGKDILYREAADVLAKLGEDGAKELAKAFEHKQFDDNISLRAHLLLALGRTEDERQIDLLLDTTTRAPEDELRAAAGEALGHFTKAKLKDKREVVKQIIRTWGSLHSRATQPEPTDPSAPVNFGPQNARQTLRACEGKWVGTLQKLTGTSHTKFPDWQRWLNKNPRWEPPK